MFKASDAAGIGVTAPAYSKFVGDLGSELSRMRINGTLDPKASAVMGELASVADEITRSSSAVFLGDLHVLRQIAQKAAQSPEGRDAMFGSKIIDKLDDFMDGLSPADIAGGASPEEAVAALQNGISTWHMARKTSAIEEAIYRAQNQASGFENGLRTQFRALLNNPR